MVAGSNPHHVVTVRMRPQEVTDVSLTTKLAIEVSGPLVPYQHNERLASNWLSAYSKDPWVAETCQQAKTAGKILLVTVRDSRAGWQIIGCDIWE